MLAAPATSGALYRALPPSGTFRGMSSTIPPPRTDIPAGIEKIEFEILDFAPPEAIVGRIHPLFEVVFGEAEQAELVESLSRRTTVMAILAREDVEVIGFKIGFEDEPGVYRSWTGAVSPRWQGKGVGARLLDIQHSWCEENGYECVRTVGYNEYKEMLQLNLSQGFDVVGTRLAADGGLEILLEKDLYPNGPPEDHSDSVDVAANNDEAG